MHLVLVNFHWRLKTFKCSMLWDIDYQRSATCYEYSVEERWCQRKENRYSKLRYLNVCKANKCPISEKLTKLSWWLQKSSKPTDVPYLWILGPASIKTITYLKSASKECTTWANGTRNSILLFWIPIISATAEQAHSFVSIWIYPTFYSTLITPLTWAREVLMSQPSSFTRLCKPLFIPDWRQWGASPTASLCLQACSQQWDSMKLWEGFYGLKASLMQRSASKVQDDSFSQG